MKKIKAHAAWLNNLHKTVKNDQLTKEIVVLLRQLSIQEKESLLKELKLQTLLK